MIYRDGRITRITNRWPGAVTCEVAVTKVPEGAGDFLPVGATVLALAYPDLVGPIAEDDCVRIEASAVAKSLGTSAGAMVVANLSALPADVFPEDGHVVKARYMPIQPMVQAVDEPDSPHHETMLNNATLDGVPVIVADLHSALAPIALGLNAARPGAKISYIWPDTAALPVALSQQLWQLREHRLVDSVVSCGQSFGADLDAASFPSALIAAAHVAKAEVIVICQGPGNLGTATPYGFSGIAAGAWINEATVLDGRVVSAVRMSHCDPRPRHRGISHHSMTALMTFTNPGTRVVVPTFNGTDPLLQTLQKAEEEAFIPLVESATKTLESRHQVYRQEASAVLEVLRQSPVTLKTMGRGLEADPAQFIAPASAGYWVGENLLNK